MMADRGTVLVPTPDQQELSRIRPMRQRDLPTPRTCGDLTPATAGASQPPGAGVAIYAGSDAGGSLAHGLIAHEVEAPQGHRNDADRALGAACWEAAAGSTRPASPPVNHDLLCFSADPRSGPQVLAAGSGGAATGWSSSRTGESPVEQGRPDPYRSSSPYICTTTMRCPSRCAIPTWVSLARLV